MARVIDSDPVAEVDAVNRCVEDLRTSLESVEARLSGTRRFALQDVHVESGTSLKIHAQYNVTRKKHTGDSGAMKRLNESARRALDDLLQQTLFHPDHGPFGSLTVEECVEVALPGERKLLELKIFWAEGVGIQHGMAYEIAAPSLLQPTQPVGYGYYLPSGKYEIHDGDGPNQAILKVEEITDPKGVSLPLACSDIQKKFLLVRIYWPVSDQESPDPKVTP